MHALLLLTRNRPGLSEFYQPVAVLESDEGEASFEVLVDGRGALAQGRTVGAAVDCGEVWVMLHPEGGAPSTCPKHCTLVCACVEPACCP
jgi:hypothetical protein